MEAPELSIIIPARDEEGNIRPLLDELQDVTSKAGISWEVVIIDDASRDQTPDRLREAKGRFSNLRVLSFHFRQGKSAALAAGVTASRSTFLGMMDADLQNCPADFLGMIDMMRQNPKLALVQGHRVLRQDTWAKRQASRVGYLTRRIILGDSVRDTGCGLRLLRREAANALPLHFEGMHRFIPFLVEANGGEVREVPVDHRPRHSGRSKYKVGVVSRGFCGLLDLLAVRWMTWRRRPLGGELFSETEGKS